MFTTYRNEEMDSRGIKAKSEGPESETFKTTAASAEQNINFEVDDHNQDISDFYTNAQFPYNMEGESLW